MMLFLRRQRRSKRRTEFLITTDLSATLFLEFSLNFPWSSRKGQTLFNIKIWLRCRSLVTFQYVQALLVGRVRTRVVWGAEAATICVSYPVSTVTRMLRPLRRFDPFWSCASICMSTTAKRHVEKSLAQLRIQRGDDQHLRNTSKRPKEKLWPCVLISCNPPIKEEQWTYQSYLWSFVPE